MFSRERRKIEGTVERFATHSWDMSSTGYVVLLEGHAKPYFLMRGLGGNGTTPYPISLTEKGDRVALLVDNSDNAFVGDFRNETLEKRFGIPNSSSDSVAA